MAELQPAVDGRRRRVGIVPRDRGHALRGLRPHGRGGAGRHARACAACKSTAPRRRRASSGRPPPAGLRAGSRPCSAPATAALPAADLLSARAAPAGATAAAVALAGRGLLHDAGDDVRRRRPTSPQPGDMTPDIAALLRWASWVLTLPVLLFSCRPVLRSRPGATCASGASAWTCRWRWASSIAFVASTAATFDPGGAAGRRGLVRLAHDVRLLPAVRALLEQRLRDRTAGALEALMRRLPDTRRAAVGRRRVRARRGAPARAPATWSACCRARPSRPTAP